MIRFIHVNRTHSPTALVSNPVRGAGAGQLHVPILRSVRPECDSRSRSHRAGCRGGYRRCVEPGHVVFSLQPGQGRAACLPDSSGSQAGCSVRMSGDFRPRLADKPASLRSGRYSGRSGDPACPTAWVHAGHGPDTSSAALAPDQNAPRRNGCCATSGTSLSSAQQPYRENHCCGGGSPIGWNHPLRNTLLRSSRRLGGSS
jgi:hypothetical protein